MSEDGDAADPATDPPVDPGTLETHLLAGAAVHNAGEYHAAHDAWEALWLDLPASDEKDLLQGLIQFTAAVFHATHRNWAGTTGLAGSALEYLDGLGDEPYGVALGPVRSYLAVLARDPEVVERRAPVRLAVGGEVVEAAEMRFEAVAVAADVLAEEYADAVGAVREGLVERAVEYGRADVADGRASSPFVRLLVAFVEGERGVVLQRLADHVDRRDHRERDVDGLFDAGAGSERASGTGNDDDR